MDEKEPGPLNRSDPDKANYSPNGVVGDPSKASAEKGRVLVEAMLEDVCAGVGE